MRLMFQCLVAAFHGSELYAQLAPAVGPLMRLLGDSASRNQCNAAGALGNLTRHADTVVPTILREGAVQVCDDAVRLSLQNQDVFIS